MNANQFNACLDSDASEGTDLAATASATTMSNDVITLALSSKESNPVYAQAIIRRLSGDDISGFLLDANLQDCNVLCEQNPEALLKLYLRRLIDMRV